LESILNISAKRHQSRTQCRAKIQASGAAS